MSAHPVVQSDDFSLPALVRAALAGDEADPHRIADDLIASMDLADTRRALALTLPDYVAKHIHRTRRHGPAPSSRRWDNVAELHATGELTLLRVRVFASGAWKFLGDCSRVDVDDLTTQRDALAVENAAAADRFRRLRVAMGRKRVTVVRDLPPDVLSEIFDA